MRQISWRVFILASLVLASQLLASSPTNALAEPAFGRTTFSGPGGYLGVNELGLGDVRDMVVVEAHDRLVISGDDQLDFYTASSVEYLFSVEGGMGAGSIDVAEDTVFVAARTSGTIIEIDVLDGTIRQQWHTGAEGLYDIGVSPTYIWFTHHPTDSRAYVSRIDRTSGDLQPMISTNAWPSEFWISVDKADENLYFVASRGHSLARFNWDGTSASYADHPDLASLTTDFAVGLLNSTIWSERYRRGSTASPNSGVEPLRYLTEVMAGTMALEATDSAHAVVSGNVWNVGLVELFDASASEPRNRFFTSSNPRRVAVSKQRVFAVSGSDGLSLDAWPLDYVEQPTSLTVRVDLHGEADGTLAHVVVTCTVAQAVKGRFARIEFEASFPYGSSHTFTIPARHRKCNASYRTDVKVQAFAKVWTGSHWATRSSCPPRVDPMMQSDVSIALLSLSPVNDLGLFIRQTFDDVLGRAPTDLELYEAGTAIYEGQTTVEEFVVELMDVEARYETSKAPIDRLYRAFFLRDPDWSGFEYWVEQEEQGKALFLIAEFFSISPEFQERYGVLSDREFVRLVYRNVLGRVPDEAGFQLWQDQMASGMSRGELMTYFSDSPEYRGYHSDRVFVLYAARALEQRDPSEAQINDLVGTYRDGAKSLVVAELLGGELYFGRFWASDVGTGVGSLHDAALMVVEPVLLAEQLPSPIRPLVMPSR